MVLFVLFSQKQISEIKLYPLPFMSSHQGIVHLKISFIDNGEECVAYKYDVPDIKTAQRMDDGSKKMDDGVKKSLTMTHTDISMSNGSNGGGGGGGGGVGVRNNSSDGIVIKLDSCKPLSGDIKVEFYTKQMMPRRKPLFSFWFNTFFESERENDGE